MNQPLQEFFAEAEDLIEHLSLDLQALREQRADGQARRQLVGRIFRYVHTLKGAAATFELAATAQLAHEFETLLNAIRLGHVAIDEDVLGAMDESALALSETLSHAARHVDEASRNDAPSLQNLITRIQRLALQSASTSPISSSPSSKNISTFVLPTDLASAISEQEKARLNEAANENLHLYFIAVSFDLITFDESFRSLSDALTARGELISTLPDLDEDAPQRIGFRLVYATASNLSEVNERIASFGEIFLEEIVGSVIDEREGHESDIVESSESTFPHLSFPTTIAPLTAFVRVELSELDELIATTNALLKKTTRALDRAEARAVLHAQANTNAPLEATASADNFAAPVDAVEAQSERARLYHHFIEVEEKLIGLRMIPVGQNFRRAVRAGEVVARLTGKEIDFEIAGGDVRLDKWLADALADPLLHLLRNAVDHGIEQSEERRRKGKHARGRVRLEAATEGSRIILRVSDDGGGVDLERVAQAAIDAGIVEEGAVITQEKSLRLIFRPGFTTASAVSNISGRGVGLDVVESAVERAGGELHVRSVAGAGTTFEINAPSAFAVVNVFVAQAGGHHYCLDANSVAEVGIIAGVDIERHDANEAMNWRGAHIPLVRLRSLLALPDDEGQAKEQLNVIVIDLAGGSKPTLNEPALNDESASHLVGIVVDAVGQRIDALVRSLGRHASRWHGIGGATELPDGTVALMLDLPRLLKTVEIIAEKTEE